MTDIHLGWFGGINLWRILWPFGKTHVFFVCSKAAKCWKKIGLHSLVQELLLTTNNFSTMIFHLLNRLAPQQQSLVDMFPWSLWKNCNSKLWKSPITPHASLLLEQMIHLMNRIVCEAQSYRHAMRIPLIFWAKSYVGTVKCNVDALSFNPIMEYNMCFRDSLDHSCLANKIIITPPWFWKLNP